MSAALWRNTVVVKEENKGGGIERTGGHVHHLQSCTEHDGGGPSRCGVLTSLLTRLCSRMGLLGWKIHLQGLVGSISPNQKDDIILEKNDIKFLSRYNCFDLASHNSWTRGKQQKNVEWKRDHLAGWWIKFTSCPATETRFRDQKISCGISMVPQKTSPEQQQQKVYLGNFYFKWNNFVHIHFANLNIFTGIFHILSLTIKLEIYTFTTNTGRLGHLTFRQKAACYLGKFVAAFS